MTAELFSGDIRIFGEVREGEPVVMMHNVITCRFAFQPPPDPLQAMAPREIMAYRAGMQDGTRYLAHWQGQAQGAIAILDKQQQALRDCSLQWGQSANSVQEKLLAISPALQKDVTRLVQRAIVSTGLLAIGINTVTIGGLLLARLAGLL
jgi:hypothetical protein